MAGPSVEKPRESRRQGRASSPAVRKPVEAETKADASAKGQSAGATGKKSIYFKLGGFALAIMAAIVLLLWTVSTKKVPLPKQTLDSAYSWISTNAKAVGVGLLTVVAMNVVGFTVKHYTAKKAAKQKSV